MDAMDLLQLQEEHVPVRYYRPEMPGTAGTQRVKSGVVHCLDCDTEIPPARLKALPHATLCCDCANIQEQNRKRAL